MVTVAARIFPLGCDFLLPYLEPYSCFTSDLASADFILAANNTDPSYRQLLRSARSVKKPVAWWTIEDPNSFESFLSQAAEADFVFTSDEACVALYRERLVHDRVFWLPLACSPEFHYPAALAPGADEFVISANWYTNEARLWGVQTVVEPLRRAGRSIALFCYEDFMWPDVYRPYSRGARDYRTVADQYRHGRVVLGINNQRSGLDGISRTVMTSMRTFEALACGKPFLAAHSDGYERLGLMHGQHLASIRTTDDALRWADRLLGETGERIGEEGRRFVLDRHTYGHRLRVIVDIVTGPVRSFGRPAPCEPCAEVPELQTRLEQLQIDRSLNERVLALAREHDSGNMRYAELLALAIATLSFPWTPDQFICEIGTFQGITACFLGRLAILAELPCAVISIDNFESPYLPAGPDALSAYFENVSAHRLLPGRNFLIPMQSRTASAYVRSGIGVLLIDGGHDYETCRDDLAFYVPKVAREGVVAVDDVWYTSVRQAVDEFPWEAEGFEIELRLEKIELYRRIR